MILLSNSNCTDASVVHLNLSILYFYSKRSFLALELYLLLILDIMFIADNSSSKTGTFWGSEVAQL